MPDISATRLRPDQLTSLNEVVNLEIALRRSPGATWPEHPQRSSIVLLNRDRVLHLNQERRPPSQGSTLRTGLLEG